MRDFHFNDERYFTWALILSVTIHGVLITATGLIPSAPEVSVFEAPNSLEINIIKQPLVSVIEEKIVTEEIIREDEKVAQEIVLSERVKATISESSNQPSIDSQESRGAITKAKPLMHTNPAPTYPRIARQRGWEGTVRLTAFIEKDGTPNHVGIAESSGYGILDKAAQKTVKMWKFSPAQAGPVRFSSRISIPIRFDLIKEQ